MQRVSEKRATIGQMAKAADKKGKVEMGKWHYVTNDDGCTIFTHDHKKIVTLGSQTVAREIVREHNENTCACGRLKAECVCGPLLSAPLAANPGTDYYIE